MRQIKIFTSGLDCQINRYFEVIIQCLEPKILYEKVMVLFSKIKNSNKISTFSLNILVYSNKFLMKKFSS